MQEIDAKELKRMIDAKENFDIVDVREPYENEQANIGGKLIPLAFVVERKDEIDPERKTVVHCRAGVRSATAIRALEGLGFKNLINLKGGLEAWRREVDPNLPLS